jgi:hypothetical protein
MKRHNPVTGSDILGSGGNKLYFRLKSLNRLFLQVNSDIFLKCRRNIGFSAGIIGATGLYLSFSFPLKNTETDLTINSAYGNFNFDSYYLTNEGSEPYLLRQTYAVAGVTRYLFGNFIIMGGIAYGRTEFFQKFQAISYFNNVPPEQLIAYRGDLSGKSAGFDVGLAYWIKKKVVLSINNTSFITDKDVRDEFGNLMLERPTTSISDLRVSLGYTF